MATDVAEVKKVANSKDPKKEELSKDYPSELSKHYFPSARSVGNRSLTSLSKDLPSAPI